MLKHAVHGSTHGDDAAVTWRRLVWVQLQSNCRLHTIGAYQQIAVDRGAIHAQRDAPANGAEAVDPGAQRDRLQTNGIEQRPVKGRPQGHEHRTAECIRRQLSSFQHGTVHAPKLASPWLKAASDHGITDTKLAQCGDGIRCDADAKAELTQRRCLLENADIPAGLAQSKAGRKAADAGAND